MKTKLRSLVLATTSLVLLCAAPANLEAATIDVTTTADSGPGSLRAALTSSDNGDTIDATGVTGTITLTSGELTVDKSVIILGPGAAALTVSGNHASRVFYITGTNVTIRGLTIADGSGPGITTYAGTSANIIAISDCVVTNNHTSGVGGGILNGSGLRGVTMTISNCIISGNSATNDGGGIYNFNSDSWFGDSTLTINASIVSGNWAHNGSGGGIFNHGYGAKASLTINDSIVSGNSATAGGGIYNCGNYYSYDEYNSPGNATLTINATLISSNSASNGGGICNIGNLSSANLIVNTSTITGNSATNDGGGISSSAYYSNYGYYRSGGARITITGSTISDNSAGDSGGGISCDGGYLGFTTLTLYASTVSGNSAVYGGGIWNDSGLGAFALTINASTLAGNSATDGGSFYNSATNGGSTLQIGDTILNAGASGENIYNDSGTIVSRGYNLCSDDGGGFLTNATDQVNTDPLLGPLQDNGGLTFTHALLANSPAIDKGKRDAVTNLVSNTDQRGMPRPVDFAGTPNATGGDGSDIGAFEAQMILGCNPLVITGPVKCADGSFQFCFTNTPAACFTVFSTANLALPFSNWTMLGAPIEIAPGQFQFADAQATNCPQRYYRVTSP